MGVGIRFGNMKINEVEDKHNIKFTDEEVRILNEHRTDSANDIGVNEFHIFDLPITFFECGEEAWDIVYEILAKYGSEMEGQIGAGK